MPALSSTMKEGKVVSWLKSEGDAVSSGEAIMVVESDKADMDVEAFEDGYLAAIVTGEGESCAVGSVVAYIAENEGDVAALKAYAASVGGGAAAAPVAAAAAAPAAAVSAPKVTKAPAASAASGDRVVASPLAKKMAQEMGVDISSVVGTGPGGREYIIYISCTCIDIQHITYTHHSCSYCLPNYYLDKHSCIAISRHHCRRHSKRCLRRSRTKESCRRRPIQTSLDTRTRSHRRNTHGTSLGQKGQTRPLLHPRNRRIRQSHRRRCQDCHW